MMYQAKCQIGFLFCSTLLMVSCHETDDVIERDGAVINSTNITSLAYGLTASAVAVILYGSNFIPVKMVETGDGMFFQWVYCAAVWMISKIGDLILKSPKFHPLAMLGGAIWATGNLAVVPIVKSIGLGLGILIWGSSSLLMGWATSRFGWFGISPQEVSRPVLDYCGAGLCLLSGLIFFFVKTNLGTHPSSESSPLLIDRRTTSGSYGTTSSQVWIDAIGPKPRRFIGCLLAVVSGLTFGSSFAPVLYIKSHASCRDSLYYSASLYDPDYVYALGSGIFLTSTVYFLVYCATMNNRPKVYSRAVMPAFMSGVMCGLATYCLFLANTYLSAVVTIPMVTAGCSVVAALWGTLVFREVRGGCSCFAFVLATCAVLTGSTLTALSKM